MPHTMPRIEAGLGWPPGRAGAILAGEIESTEGTSLAVPNVSRVAADLMTAGWVVSKPHHGGAE